QIFRAQTRQRDMTARYGGDEFAIILPNTDEPAAMLVAERIRWDVEQTRALQCAIKISLGVAIFAPPMTVAQFIELADRALYRAKTQGRNLVVNARQLSQDVR
ncbi:MAG: GGDEF domain-containing protein, partial [Chloroflexales bacterium]